MQKTIFQRIIDREIPAGIEFENDDLIVIRDIAPSAPLHLLIIPKRLIQSIDALDNSDAELIGRIHLVARDMARKFGVAESGYRIVTNCNSDGGQTVFHLHFHLLAGEPLGRMNSTHTAHQAVASASTMRSTLLRDIGLLVLCAIGLAVGFNMMNPKRIPWIKPTYDRVQASTDDILRYATKDSAIAAANPDTSVTASTPVANKTTPLTTPAAQTGTSAQPTSQPSAEVKPATAVKQTESSFEPQPGLVKEINYEMFTRLLNGSEHYLIDARGADKFAQGHISGAVNFYGGEVQSRIPDILSNVPRDRVILIYCDGGECELSHHVADVLKQFGYGPVFIFTGGWAEWTAKRK